MNASRPPQVEGLRIKAAVPILPDVFQPPPDLRIQLVGDDEAVALRIEEIGELVAVDPDVVIVDQPDGSPHHQPSLALVAGPFDADPWLHRGYRAALPRDVEPETLQAAIQAVMAGLVVQPAPQDPVSAGVPELTPRELEVLELLAQGFSNREIGETLDISSHTAKFHVQGLLDKLDATTRTEAAVRAARLWII